MKNIIFKGHDHSSKLDKFDRRAKWEMRFRNLSEVGKVHYIWECEWKSQIKQHYFILLILKMSCSVEYLMEHYSVSQLYP